MIFSAANCGFIVLAGIVVVVTVRWFLPRVARQIWKEAKSTISISAFVEEELMISSIDNIVDLYYVCFVIAIVCANAYVAALFLFFFFFLFFLLPLILLACQIHLFLDRHATHEGTYFDSVSGDSV